MKNKKKINKLIRIFDYKMWFYDLIKFIGCVPVLIDLRIKRIYVKDGKVCKRPNNLLKNDFLVISNHMSYIDPVILGNAFWERRLGYIATIELFQGKIFGTFLKGCGCIPIDKENITLKTFKAVEERFNRGHIVALFPEGQIETGDEQLKQFKSGAVLIALNCEVPILPIYLEKRTNRLKRQRVFIGEKINVMDYCNEPIPTMDTIHKMSELLRKQEKDLEAVSKGFAIEQKKKINV